MPSIVEVLGIETIKAIQKEQEEALPIEKSTGIIQPRPEYDNALETIKSLPVEATRDRSYLIHELERLLDRFNQFREHVDNLGTKAVYY